MLAVIVCIVAALLLAVTPVHAQAPKRVALVIGNQTYQSLTRLDNPRLDAGRLAALLDANGFDVVRCDGQNPGCFDLDRDGLETALDTLRKKADGADVALVFYAGHGMEGRDGNVLAPVDMEVIDCVGRSLRRGVPLDALLKAAAGARSKIVILDACRNDPFAQCPPRRGVRRVSFGELTVPESESYLLVSSTKPGQEALDGPAGGHSPYARALLQWLEKTPELYFPQVLSYVAKEVIENTARADRTATQVPEMLQRGEAPGACLKGEGCVGDVRFAALSQELEALKREHVRDQDAKAIADDYLAAAEKARAGRPLTEEEKREQLQSLKEVSKGVGDFMLEAAKGRGRPFSREDEAQERARLMDAIRALPALGDTRAERALELLKAGDETEAERLFAEDAAARERAAQIAESRAAEENRKAAQSLRHLAAIAKPKTVAKAADTYKKATLLDPADAQTWIDYARAAYDAGRAAEAKAAFEQADIKARARGDLLVRHRAALGLGDVALDLASDDDRGRHYREALALADELAKGDPGDPAAWRAQARGHDRIGRIFFLQSLLRAGSDRRSTVADAVEHYKIAVALSERLAGVDAGNQDDQLGLATARSLLGWALASMGDRAGSLAAFRAALEVVDRHNKADPDNAEWLDNARFLHEAIANMQEEGDLDAALASLRMAVDLAERAAKVDPSNTKWLLSLESAHSSMALFLDHFRRDHAGALASYQAARVVAERLTSIDPGNVSFQGRLAGEHSRIGGMLMKQGDLAGAVESLRQSLAIHDRRVASNPTNTELHTDRASVHDEMGEVLRARGDLPGALASYRAAIAGFEKADPSDVLRQANLWMANAHAGWVREQQGDLAGALGNYQTGQAIVEQLASVDPSRHRDGVSLLPGKIGSLQEKQGNLADALARYRQALALNEERLKARPDDAVRQQDISWNHADIGGVLLKQGHRAEALASFRAVLVIDEQRRKAKPGDVDLAQRIALYHNVVGDTLFQLSDPDGALESHRAALASQGRLDQDAIAALNALGYAHYRIGSILQLRGDLAGALASLEAGLAAYERLASVDSGNADRQGPVWSSHNVIGRVLQDQGRLADALAHHATAQDIAERRSKPDPGNPGWRSFLATSYSGVGAVKLAKGDRTGALALWRKALAIAEASAARAEQDETKSAGKPGQKTAAALIDVQWYALLARQPAKALATWERARALVPEPSPGHEINHAHALLLRNRVREATALYLAGKGKGKLSGDTPWELVIAVDFHDLRRAGLAHPAMREIEAALGVPPLPAGRPDTSGAARDGKR